MDILGFRYEHLVEYQPSDRPSDQNVADTFDYLQQYKNRYEKVVVTDNDRNVLAESRSGWVVYPVILALHDIKLNLITKPNQFHSDTFITALKQVGYDNLNAKYTIEEASKLIKTLFRPTKTSTI